MDYTYAKTKVDDLTNLIEKYNTIQNECSTYAFYIAHFKTYFQLIQNKQTIDSEILNYQLRVEKLNDIVSTFNFATSFAENINSYKSKLIYRDTLTQNIQECRQLISDVENEYRSAIPLCPCCQGSGIDPTHPAHAAKLQEIQWHLSTH